MKFQTQLTWDAPLARVLAMITDRAYVERKQALMNEDARWEIAAHSDDGRHFRISTRFFSKPGANLPAIARRFIKDDQVIELIQHDHWDRETASAVCSLENTAFQAITVTSRMQLTEAGGVTTNTVSWDVSCSIPLVGGKLAELVAEEIRAKAALNERISREILAAGY